MKKSRITLCLAGAAALAVALTGCVQQSGAAADTTSSSDQSGSVRVFISGDTNVQQLWEQALIPAFEKKYPKIKVTTTLDLHGAHDAQTLAKLTAATKQKTDPGFDLVDAGFAVQAAQGKLLTPATTSVIPNLKNVPQKTRTTCSTAVPYRASSVLIGYDSAKVKTPPKTMAALLTWIKANPGQFAYNSPNTGGSGGAFVTSVLEKYMSKSDISTMQTSAASDLESKWDKGFAALKSLNPYVYQKGVYPNGNDQVLNLLGTGAISMAPVWSDQTITAKKTGQLSKAVKFTQISPTLSGSPSCLGIPKTATHQKAAETLSNFVLSSQGQQLITTSISGYPVIPLSSMSKSVQKQFADADPSNLVPGFYGTLSTDMNNLWSQKVPSA